MFVVGIDGHGARPLRPRDAAGATCHQLVTHNGITYEAVRHDGVRRHNVLGRYTLRFDTWREHPIPDDAYVHTGFDPAGRFVFYESDGREHALRCVHHLEDPARRRVETLRVLPPIPFGQRHQAHPFLSTDRRRLFFTELVDGFSQVSSMEVGDLVDQETGWR